MTTKDETRAAILAAAKGLFMRYGPVKTSMADIARELRMSPPNLYNFFPSRDAILEEVGTQQLITLRCDRGASILRKLDMDEAACDSVRHLDEHWDGSGYPEGYAGENIPLLSRISAIAQSLDVFATTLGVDQ